MGYHVFQMTLWRARRSKAGTAPGWGKDTKPSHSQAPDGDVPAPEARDPLANLKRLEANRPGFHWRATPQRDAPPKAAEESNYKSNGNGSNATTIHISLQGEGGVGKSLVAAILSQYLASRGQDVRGIDADPVNHTLSEYRGLGARCLNISKDGSVDHREFDSLMERFLTESGTFVVDTGASTFIPLWHYVLENHALEHLRERGKRVYTHSVITGGQSLSDTLSGFEQLPETTREKNIVVWLNEYFGPISRNGERFDEMMEGKKHADKVHGSVKIARRTTDTFGRDVEEMICRNLTSDEAVNGQFSLATVPIYISWSRQILR
jgi:hypothetical protein